MANVIQSFILPMFYHLFNKNTKKQVTFNTSAVKHIYEHKKYCLYSSELELKKKLQILITWALIFQYHNSL